MVNPRVPNNSMGFVRYVLAFAVVLAHFNTIFTAHFYFPISSYEAVGGFFSLSGFLIYHSYEKDKNLKNFIIRRIRRICPPYWFIVLLCAFGLVFISTLSTHEYFFNPDWWKYIISNVSFLNFLEPNLPGVFITSPISVVNGSLWTLKVEWALYLSVPVIFFVIKILGKKYKYINRIIYFIVIYFFSFLYRAFFTYKYYSTGNEIFNILSRQFLGQLMFFYSGVVIYCILPQFMAIRGLLLVISLFGLILTYYFPWIKILLDPILFSILTIGCSMFAGNLKWLNLNNISYDIYLFHFPIMQIVFQYKNYISNNIICLFMVCIVLIIILSYFSLFFIEKRFASKGSYKSLPGG